MGVRILVSRDGTEAVMYCSTTEWAFGPKFSDSDTHDAEDRLELFLDWCSGKYGDPRKFDDKRLNELYAEFRSYESDLWKAKEEDEAFDE